MGVTFAPFAIPVVTPEGEGYVVYIEGDAEVWENQRLVVALCKGGQWRHFTTAQIQSHANATFGITKPEPKPPSP